MHINLLLLYILSNVYIVQVHTQEKRFVKIVSREVRSSSLQNLNYQTRTFETGECPVLNTPNFKLIDWFLSIDSNNRSKPSVREHTTWLARQISSNQNEEIARFNSIEQRFIIRSSYKNFYSINANTGQLTITNTNDVDLLHREMTIHAETGLSQGDDILHDFYRLIRLSTTSLNCTNNMTIDVNQSIEIECSIEYEYFQYEHLNAYQPNINLTFYRREKNSLYVSVDSVNLNTNNDFLMKNNQTSIWKHSISYTIQSINKDESYREYFCIIVPDSIQNEEKIFSNTNRSCRTRIDIRNENDSTIIINRLDQFNLIDVSMIILLVLSIGLFIISFGLCIAARQYRKKRVLQIKPQNKTLPLPRNTNETQSEIPVEISSFRHKPGCPKYLPSSEYNLLSSDLFTHTTIDNIKKIILPDIPEPTDLFDDQTYIHFYIPSKTENISLKKVH